MSLLTDQERKKAKIIIIDDVRSNVALLERTLKKEGYQSVVGLTHSQDAEDLYRAYRPDLVLLDINMPEPDGFQLMEIFKTIDKDSYIPVLVLTGMQDEDIRIQALEAGAQDFLTKPFNKLEILTRIRNMLTVRILHNRVREQNTVLEEKVQDRTRELHDTRLEIIRRLGQAAEYRDNETGDHILRMSRMCASLAGLAGLSQQLTELLLNTSPMHDIGKIGIPDAVLLKPGKLTDEEWQIMTTHTTIGANILDGHNSTLMVSARDIAWTHHEKWDGSGYPRGLRGEEIPIEGRITGLVDVFDALTSRRPYKDPYPPELACKIIKEERGSHFDPRLTDLFLDNIDTFLELRQEFLTPADTIVDQYQLSERDQQES